VKGVRLQAKNFWLTRPGPPSTTWHEWLATFLSSEADRTPRDGPASGLAGVDGPAAGGEARPTSGEANVPFPCVNSQCV